MSIFGGEVSLLEGEVSPIVGKFDRSLRRIIRSSWAIIVPPRTIIECVYLFTEAFEEKRKKEEKS